MNGIKGLAAVTLTNNVRWQSQAAPALVGILRFAHAYHSVKTRFKPAADINNLIDVFASVPVQSKLTVV